MAKILNDRIVLLIAPDGKEKKCNVHHVKPVSSPEVYVGSQVEVSTGTFSLFWDSIKQDSSSANTGNPQHSYNIQSKMENL